MVQTVSGSSSIGPGSIRSRGLLFFALEVEAKAVFREISRRGRVLLPAPRFCAPTEFCFPANGFNKDRDGKKDQFWTGCVLGPGKAFERHLWEYLGTLSFRPDWVILAGFSGGLGPKAKSGATFEINEILNYLSGGPDGNPGELIRLETSVNLCRGPLATSVHSPVVLNGPREKAKVFSELHCDLVDMESLVFASAMKKLGYSYSIFRAVSDGPDESLPPLAINWMNEFGGLRPERLAWDLICNPWLIRDLFRMAKASTIAGQNLGKLVFQALDVLGG